MRRFVVIIALCLLLALPVSAFSGISSAENQTTVAQNGSCEVTLTISLQLDSIPPVLVFPLPANATGITVNGTPVTASYSGTARNVDLSGFVSTPGTYSMVIRYSQSNVVKLEEEKLTLTLELLGGFEYPVDNLSFTITLPGEAEERPVFTSTYYQDTIETMMTVTRQGAVISGTVDQRLQDHETLTMTLPVTEELFPQTVAQKWSMDTVDLLMIAVAVLALLYWFISMRCLPAKRHRRTTPPEGISAGTVGCNLTGVGVDFTMMVVSWAQMGYILIQPDDNGRVLLHKRMDMGNERSDFENRYFRMLFGRRRVVDGTGYHYAEVCRKAARSTPGAQNNFLRISGNPKVFRVLAALIGTLSGVSLALAFAADSGWQTVLGILLGILGSVVSWLIQGMAKAVHSRRKLPLLLGLGGAVAWFLLSLAAGEWNVAVFVIAAQVIAGLAAAYGGQRSDSGKQIMGEILGLRYYLKKLPNDELRQILRTNPHYYYDLAPYALALDVDRVFARKLRKARLPQCPWLTTGMDGHMTVPEWNQLLRETVAKLDALQLRLPIDRLLGK